MSSYTNFTLEVKFRIFILVLCLHLQPLYNVNLWVSYLLNQEYIAEVLCINKEKPKLQCNGKCYLRKKLEVTADSENNSIPDRIGQFAVSIVFFQELTIQDDTFEIVPLAYIPAIAYLEKSYRTWFTLLKPPPKMGDRSHIV